MSVCAAQNPGDRLWDAAWQESNGERTIKERSAHTDPAAVKLYCSWFCPFAQRAWIVLEEKKISYKYIEVNPYEVDPTQPGGYTKKQLPIETKRLRYPDFIAASPRGLVPAIHHPNKGAVWDSLHVMEYLDTTFATRAEQLIPRGDPLTTAYLNIWTAHITERIQKAFYVFLISQDPPTRTTSLQTFKDECRAVARAMAPLSDGPFFLGAHFTIFDAALAPFWQRFLWVGAAYRSLELPRGEDDADFKRLHAWWAATGARPSVAATLVCKERLVASYAQYARNEATSDCAQGLQASLGAGGVRRRRLRVPVWLRRAVLGYVYVVGVVYLSTGAAMVARSGLGRVRKQVWHWKQIRGGRAVAQEILKSSN